MIVIPSWISASNYQEFVHWRSKLVDLYVLLSLRWGFEQLTYILRLLFEFQVVKIASFVQQVDQWHNGVGPKVSFHIRQETYQSLIFPRDQNRSGQVPTGDFEGHERLAKCVVRAVIGIATTMGRFSTWLILTCTGLPSGSQKHLVFLHSPKLFEVQLQLKLILLSGVFLCDCEIDTPGKKCLLRRLVWCVCGWLMLVDTCRLLDSVLCLLFGYRLFLMRFSV